MTEEQARQLAINAINASSPMGLGFLHAEDKDYNIDDITLIDDNIYLDYFRGRMVKLDIIKKDDDLYQLSYGNSLPRTDYQSWAMKYSTYKKLAESVEGVEIVSEDTTDAQC